MLEGHEIPQSPAWWFKILAAELQDRRHGRLGAKKWSRTTRKPTRVRPPLDVLHDHFRGDPPLRGVAEAYEDAFREVTRLGRLNMAELVVTARTDRMGIAGFRTAAADDDFGDDLAAELMAETDLAVKAGDIHDGMEALGDSYGMVTPPRKGSKFPIITDEDARECITAHDPATGETLAALKLYRDDWDSADFGQLYIRQDDGSVEHRTAFRQRSNTAITYSRFRLDQHWEWKADENGNVSGRLARMPIVRFRNRRGVGVFEWHLDTLDRINDQILDKLVISKVQAFRQMAVKGLPDAEKRLVNGVMTEVEIDYSDAFVAEPGSLWQVPEGVEFWESAITDIRPLLESIKDDLEHLAAATKTPLHVITPDAAQGSAEGADLMRESSISAVGRDRAHADVGWRELISTAFAFMDGEEYRVRAQKSKITTVWDPIRSYSLAERADAASKATTTLPQDAIARDIWQYPPEEIKNLRTMRGRDLLLAGGVSAGAQQPAGRAPLAPTFQRPGQDPAQPANQPAPDAPGQ